MIANLARLADTISAALGRPVSLSQDHAAGVGPYSLHTHPNGTPLRVNYDDGLPPNFAAADAVIQAFVDTETEAEKLDKVPLSTKVIAALAIRASDRWAPLSAARKARVQAIIDAGADAAIARLT